LDQTLVFKLFWIKVDFGSWPKEKDLSAAEGFLGIGQMTAMYLKLLFSYSKRLSLQHNYIKPGIR